MFQMEAQTTDCGVVIYNKESGERLYEIPFEKEKRIGRVYRLDVTPENAGNISYSMREGKDIMPDLYGRAFLKQEYGREIAKNELQAIIVDSKYNWGNDTCPEISLEECIFYEMHVRGFTMDASSKIKEKGTFAGLKKKLPYLKDIGVTSLVVQPMYEFIEKEVTAYTKEFSYFQEKLNYWGYKEGFYFAPKANYAYTDNPVKECKDMIKAIHAQGMELIMQMYFPSTVNPNMILDALLFWSNEYHVDGFVLMGEKLPIELIKSNAYLATKKLIFDGSLEAYLPDASEMHNSYLGILKEGYYYTLRRYLKGEENTLQAALGQMREMHVDYGTIKYLSHFQGFTMYDMVAYDYKHNEANEEENRDGADYNASWNCGEEGETRKKKIQALRIKQMKNAYTMLLLSAGTPMIFMGDEFGNSQGGNNNPYCQDNSTTWLDWKKQTKNKELLETFKSLVAFRKSYSLLRPKAPYRMTDYIACGYPDVSYHGAAAWKLPQEGYHRQAGILFYGAYEQEQKDSSFYVAINMHWEKRTLAMPNLPAGMMWSLCLATDKGIVKEEMKIGEQLELEPRTICIFQSMKDPAYQNTKKRNTKTKKL